MSQQQPIQNDAVMSDTPPPVRRRIRPMSVDPSSSAAAAATATSFNTDKLYDSESSDDDEAIVFESRKSKVRSKIVSALASLDLKQFNPYDGEETESDLDDFRMRSLKRSPPLAMTEWKEFSTWRDQTDATWEELRWYLNLHVTTTVLEFAAEKEIVIELIIARSPMLYFIRPASFLEDGVVKTQSRETFLENVVKCPQLRTCMIEIARQFPLFDAFKESDLKDGITQAPAPLPAIRWNTFVRSSPDFNVTEISGLLGEALWDPKNVNEVLTFKAPSGVNTDDCLWSAHNRKKRLVERLGSLQPKNISFPDGWSLHARVKEVINDFARRQDEGKDHETDDDDDDDENDADHDDGDDCSDILSDSECDADVSFPIRINTAPTPQYALDETLELMEERRLHDKTIETMLKFGQWDELQDQLARRLLTTRKTTEELKAHMVILQAEQAKAKAEKEFDERFKADAKSREAQLRAEQKTANAKAKAEAKQQAQIADREAAQRHLKNLEAMHNARTEKFKANAAAAAAAAAAESAATAVATVVDAPLYRSQSMWEDADAKSGPEIITISSDSDSDHRPNKRSRDSDDSSSDDSPPRAVKHFKPNTVTTTTVTAGR